MAPAPFAFLIFLFGFVHFLQPFSASASPVFRTPRNRYSKAAAPALPVPKAGDIVPPAEAFRTAARQGSLGHPDLSSAKRSFLMSRIMHAAAATATALGLALASTAATAGIVESRRTITIADLNNPCTRGHDSIDGTLDIAANAERTPDGVIILRLFARGAGEDVNNVDYRFLGVGNFQFHDPLPADIVLRLRLTAPLVESSNARLVLALHVDERGRITDTGGSSLQCGTGTVM
jgi:hypothetical protein